MENNEYKGIQGHCDFDFSEDPEYPKPVNDWSRCQGTCDFDPIPIQQDGFNYETIQKN